MMSNLEKRPIKTDRDIVFGKVMARREALRERVVNLINNPELIRESQDILFVEKYDIGNPLLCFFFSVPYNEVDYPTCSIGSDIRDKRHRSLLSAYEVQSQMEGYHDQIFVIKEIFSGRGYECSFVEAKSLSPEELKGFERICEIIEQEKDGTIEA